MSEALVRGKPCSPGSYSVQYMGRWWQVEVIEDMKAEGDQGRLVVLGLPGFASGCSPSVDEFELWSLAGDYVTASAADMLHPSVRAVARLVAAYQHAQVVRAHYGMDPLQHEILSVIGQAMVHLRNSLDPGLGLDNLSSDEVPAIKEQIECWGFADREAVHARVKGLHAKENLRRAEEEHLRSREAAAEHAHDMTGRIEEEQKRREAEKKPGKSNE